ncbi:MAG: hypothetical protein M3Q75_09575 [Gemmatimonadota bacterium]|nr:hypothetical protein [Gemmatimonadota bacterium]
MRTVAGSGVPGYAADYSPALPGALWSPWAISISSGQLYIADHGNEVIRYTRL